MRLLGAPRLALTAVLVGLIGMVLSACSSDTEDIEEASGQLRVDVISVAESMADATEVGEVVHLSTCRNDGSGPIPPTTKVDLSLREGATADEARAAAEAALTGRGYETEGGSGNVLLVARRGLDDKGGGEIRLYESASSNSDLFLGTALTPTVTC